jgi:1-acyl-sn-glycerol-3-phosphate acyltransferase
MIPSNHKRAYVSFFRNYSNLMINKDFRKVAINDEFKDRGKAVLLVGNHFSWWDGFFAYYLNSKLLKRKLYVMMLEEELRKRMFLNKAGAFSVKKGSRSVIESINYAASVLDDPGNMLVMYPQGEIQSVYTMPLKFEKGIGDIIRRAKGDFQLIFYVALVDYFSFRRPSLSFYLREHEVREGFVEGSIEAEFNDFLKNSTERQRE